MDRQRMAALYLPSKEVQAELARANYYPHVRVQPLLETKDIELRLQRTKHSHGARMVIKYGGNAIGDFPDRETIDELWRDMLRRARSIFEGEG